MFSYNLISRVLHVQRPLYAILVFIPRITFVLLVYRLKNMQVMTNIRR